MSGDGPRAGSVAVRLGGLLPIYCRSSGTETSGKEKTPRLSEPPERFMARGSAPGGVPGRESDGGLIPGRDPPAEGKILRRPAG